MKAPELDRDGWLVSDIRYRCPAGCELDVHHAAPLDPDHRCKGHHLRMVCVGYVPGDSP